MDSLELRDAIKVLNERRHRESGWMEGGSPGGDQWAHGEDQYDNLEAFEAIAIAEKYLREAVDPQEGRPTVA